MSAEEAKIVFMPSGRRGHFALGTPVLQAARSLGVDVDSVCGGRGMCGRCQVLCAQGQFAKHGIVSTAEHLSPVNATEERYARLRSLKPGRRLSCQALIQGDAVIDVPPESQVHRQVVRKEAQAREIVLDVAVHLYYVEVEEADMHDPKGDLQRLQEALTREWELEDLSCDVGVLAHLQATLRAGKWSVTVAVHKGERIAAVWPGFQQRALGLAIDLGSTTIAAHLCDLSSGTVLESGGIMNPQIRFGEDLMSRVSYVMMHPEGAAEMTAAVRTGIDDLVAEITTAAGASPDEVLDVVIVGNPIMHHLLLGISPVELGGAPFALATDAAVETRAGTLGLNINPGASVYILPCIAGHVGADSAGVILAEEPYRQDKVTLLVDIGTNAEIVLGNDQRLLACSSPTGPAFEGAQISCGQRAAPGAIERVRIDRETLEPRFRVIGSQRWSDEPEFAESISGIGVTGICGSGIIEAVAELFLAGILSRDGVIDGAMAARSPRIFKDGRTWSYLLFEQDNVICVSQTDVRQIQLAKGALYAGTRLLMDRFGTQQVDRIRLAGAFGSHIDVRHAMVLGLIPDCPLDQVSSAGNAAGTGARIALLNRASRREIEKTVRAVEKIETAVEPRFQEYFVDAMAFPHRTDSFPNLAAAVELPAASTAGGREGAAPRRRRKRKTGVKNRPGAGD